MLLIKAQCWHWDSRTAGSGGGHAELSNTRRSGRPTTAFWGCFNVLMNSLETTDGLQPETLQLSCRHPSVVWTILLMPYDVQTLCSLGSTKSNRLSQNPAERGLLKFSLPFSEADDESLLSRIVTGDETRIRHFELQSKSEWNGIAFLLLGSHRFSRGTNGHCFLVGRTDAEGVILVEFYANHSLRSVHTLKTVQKRFRRA